MSATSRFGAAPCGHDGNVTRREAAGAASGARSLWLVRHAESNGNVADDAARSARAARLTFDVRDPDVDLSPTGTRQAAALGIWLRGLAVEEQPDVVLCSPYVRARRTAEVAIDSAGRSLDIHVDERLRERDLGVFDGYTGSGIRETFPEEAERRQRLGKFYYRPPGGESWADVALRIRSLLMSMAADSAFSGRRVLVVTHQAVAMVFRYVVEDLSEQQVLDIDAATQIANCAVTAYDEVDGRLVLRRFNDVAHLSRVDEPVTEEPDAAAVSS